MKISCLLKWSLVTFYSAVYLHWRPAYFSPTAGTQQYKRLWRPYKNVVRTLETHHRSAWNCISRFVSYFCLMCNRQLQVQGTKKYCLQISNIYLYQWQVITFFFMQQISCIRCTLSCHEVSFSPIDNQTKRNTDRSDTQRKTMKEKLKTNQTKKQPQTPTTTCMPQMPLGQNSGNYI